MSSLNELTLQWTKLIGGTGDDYIRAITTGSDGSVYVAGYTSSSSLNEQTNVGTSSTTDGVLAKYNADGDIQWTKLIGGTNNDYITAITTGSDGSVYVAGYTISDPFNGVPKIGNSDGFLVKCDTNGNLQWTKLIGGAGADSITRITTGSDGSIYVVGYTSSNSLNGVTKSVGTDGFLVKYNTNGDIQWTKLIGGAGTDYIMGITTGSDGSIYVAGYTNSNPLNQQTNAGSRDGFLTKYNTNGDIQWTKLNGGTSDDYIMGITTGSDGSIYVAGYTSSSSLNEQTQAGPDKTEDGFLAKYNTTGDIQWTKLIGGTSNDNIFSITTGSDGSVYVAGYTTSSSLNGLTAAGGYDGFFAKYNTSGNLQWTELIRGTGDDYIRAITTRSDGSVYVAGYTNSNPLNEQTNAGGQDGFLAKYASQSNKITPSINFSIQPRTYGDVSFTLNPVSDSSGTFSFDSSNVNVAIIDGNIVTIKGAGNTVITVRQDACGNYTDGSANVTFTVNPAMPNIISNFTIPRTTIEHTKIQLLPPQSTNTTVQFTYTSSNTNVADISGSILIIKSTGTSTITATQAATLNYLSKSITAIFDTSYIHFPLPTEIAPNQIIGTSEPNSTIVVTGKTLYNQEITYQTQSNIQGIWNFNITMPSNYYSFRPLNTNQFVSSIQNNFSAKYREKSYKLTVGMPVIIKPREYVRNSLDNRWWRISPKLPAGLKFSQTTGKISGIPQLSMTSTKYKITSNSQIYLSCAMEITLEIV